MSHSFDPHSNPYQTPADTSGAASPQRPDRGSPGAARSWMIGAAIVAAAGVGSFAATSLAGAQESTSTTAAESSATTGADATTKGDCAPGDADGGREGRGDRRGAVRGTVTAVDGSTVTVTDDDGESTAISFDDTTVVATATAADLSKLEVGQQVRVRGERSDDGSAITAETVVAGDAALLDPQPPAKADTDSADTDSADTDSADTNGADTSKRGRGAPAVIASITADGFTMTKQDGTTVTVTVDAETTYTVISAATAADITAGDIVTVRGARPPKASTDEANTDEATATQPARSIVIGDVDDLFGGGRGGFGGGRGGGPGHDKPAGN